MKLNKTMSNRDAKKVLEEARKVLQTPIRGPSQIYWVTYKIHEKPDYESTSHCDSVSIYLQPLTRPDDENNKNKAETEFKTKKEAELKQEIIILGVFLDSDKCKERVERENKTQNFVKWQVESPRNP